MKSLTVKPRCRKTPCSRYCVVITSSAAKAAAEPTISASSPWDTFPDSEYVSFKILAIDTWGISYHVEADTTVSLGFEHDAVHDIHCFIPSDLVVNW